jgi:16S rRNA (cytosine967-C5)-methyltransferase
MSFRGKHRRKKKPASARELAALILSAVDSRAAYSDRLLWSYLGTADLSLEDRGLLTRLVKGTLRFRGNVDWVLSSFLKTELDTLPVWIRNVLRLGAFQLLFMDRIPPSAATDESVKLARKRGHPGTAGLVNAVLRRIAEGKDAIEYPSIEEDPVRAISIIHSHPEWIVSRWLHRFGVQRTISICEANNSIDWICIRPNPIRTEPPGLLTRLRNEGIVAERGHVNADVLRVEGELAPANDPSFKEGLYTPQDEAESLVCHLLSVETGATFVDFCAAPGGKATQIAEMARDEKPVFCLEVHPPRARQIAESAGRLGLTSLSVIACDSRTPPLKCKSGRILVDAPCSGLGVLGKRADARWRKREESLAVLSKLQRELLESASKLLDKGGVLVYSVCSFEPEETSELIRSFVCEHSDLKIEGAINFVPAPLTDEAGAMLILPDDYGTDGVFAVRLVKTK